MREQQLIAQKSENIWIILWEVCDQWLTLFFQLLIHAVEGIPAIKQLLESSGIQAFYSSASQATHLTRGSKLLAPRDCEDSNRLTVVLDLDETLVCAYESTGLPPLIHSQALRSGLKWFELQCVAIDKDGGKKFRPNNITVYERPGLQEFLRKVGDFAEVVLFTAGLEGYASPLVDRIDPEKKIGARLYRPATVVSRYRKHVKDLSVLGRDLSRTVIIDNNPFSFVLQPMNGIPCVPFTGEHADDQHLLGVLLPLLQYLSSQNDIRPALLERFHMPAWFRKRGIRTSDWPS